MVKNIPVGMKFDPRDARKLGEFLYGIFVELKRALKPGGFCIVFSQARSCHHVGVSLENAGFELREPGCSACLAMNDDKVPAGKLAVSTSNRNFEGRQGPGSRTLLASPLVAAASAVMGKVTDPRDLL